MKIKKLLIFIFMVGLLVCISSISAFAMHTGFETEELSQEEKDTVLENLSFTLLSEEPKPNTIECLDVHEDGRIATGTSGTSTRTISVYSPEGTFLYGYLWEDVQSFGIAWDGDNMLVYLVRSSLAVSVSPNGEILELLDIKDSMENDKYWRKVVFATERKVADKQYNLQNNMGIFNFFASSYAQLVETDADGTTKMLYDINTAYTIKIAVIFVFVLTMFIGGGFYIVHHILKQQKADTKSQQMPYNGSNQNGCNVR